MFTIKLFRFSKKENSTAVPDSASASSFSCVLKKDSGIIRPIIELDIGLSTAPNYNYAFIPAYNRYYWIENWTNINPLWSAELKVDVLASNKSAIGASNLYVLRSSSAYDGDIIDSYYNHKTNSSIEEYAITRPHDVDPRGTGGSYIIGLISSDVNNLSAYLSQYGSIRYIQMDRKNLLKLVDYLTDKNNWTALDFNLTDASVSLQKSLADPLQFIKSCLWLPLPIEASLAPTDLDFYGWTIPNMEYLPVSNLTMVKMASVSVNIPKHPATASRGNYVNVSPNTKLWLDIAPYGMIELDTTITANASSITLIEDIDMIDGKGILSIEANGCTIDKYNAQIGVPINLSQVTRDYLGMAKGALASVAGGVEAGLGGVLMSLTGGMMGADSIVGGITGAIGGAVDAYQASFPKSKSLGGGGGFVDLCQQWWLISQFFMQTDDDNDHVGRPLYQNRVINTLSGFIIVKDGSIPLPVTSAEAQEVKDYLERGFYYE